MIAALLAKSPWLLLLAYHLTVFGFCWIVGHSRISLPFRTFVVLVGDPRRGAPKAAHVASSWLIDLIECPACLGTWIGFAAGWHLTRSPWLTLAAGCYTAGANFLLGRVTGLIAEP